MDVLAISEDARVVPHFQAIGATRLSRTSWSLGYIGSLERLASDITRCVPAGTEFLLAEVIGCVTGYCVRPISPKQR